MALQFLSYYELYNPFYKQKIDTDTPENWERRAPKIFYLITSEFLNTPENLQKNQKISNPNEINSYFIAFLLMMSKNPDFNESSIPLLVPNKYTIRGIMVKPTTLRDIYELGKKKNASFSQIETFNNLREQDKKNMAY